MSNRPYVYKRAEDLGLPMIDATKPLKVVVTQNDVVKATKANSKLCALSRASLRLPGVQAAYFFRSTAFLEYTNKMVRHALPPSVQKEIVSFDRAKVFAPGVYQLSSVAPANTQKAQNQRRKKQHSEHRKASRPMTKQDFKEAVKRVINHEGSKSVSGMRNPSAPEPLPNRAPSRYVHRTQYVRDLREPK